MKHSLKITLILLTIFLATQYIGLAVVNNYVGEKTTYIDENNETQINITWKELPGNIERPDIKEDQSHFLIIYIVIAIAIGTALLLVIAKFGFILVWRFWFFLAAVAGLTFAFGSFIDWTAALIMSIIFSYMKTFRPNIYIHNLTELFLYGGLAAIFVPIEGFTITWAIILLIIISIYDAWAVWKSKHMVTMAKFQSKTNMFAGLLIPYKLPKGEKVTKTTKTKPVKVKNAVLGGGDMGFPLMFAGVVMKTFPIKALIIPVFAAAALAYLLLYSKKDRYYPAMPFISTGCLLGYGAVLLLNLL